MKNKEAASAEDPVIIILDRHPQSLGNRDGASAYVEYGDPKVGITDLGLEQARKQAEFMVGFFQRNNITEMPQIWAGDYQRVREGMNEKLKRIHELAPSLIKPDQVIHTDDMLTERSFGSLPYAQHLIDTVFKDNPAAQEAIKADITRSRAVFNGNQHSARPENGESRKDMSAFLRAWRDSLERDIQEGSKVHWVMGHGDVIRAIVTKQLHWHGQEDWQKFPEPGNCDVIVIKGTKGDWSVQKVYDGEEMRATPENPIYRGKPQRIQDLPFVQNLGRD